MQRIREFRRSVAGRLFREPVSSQVLTELFLTGGSTGIYRFLERAREENLWVPAILAGFFRNIWFAPEVSTEAERMDGGLREYIRPLSGTALVPGHDGLRARRSS